MSTTTVESEEKVADKNDAADHEVTIPIAIKCEHYQLGGRIGWWKRITKAQAKVTRAADVVQAMFGDKSLGWFIRVPLVK